MLRSSLLPLLLLLAPTSAARAIELHVDSTVGSDHTGDGSRARPFASLHRAQRAVRAELRQISQSGEHAEAESSDITVSVGPGVHALNEPLRFDSRDSGRAGRRVVWRGHGGESTRILGGPMVGDWEHAWGNVYRSKLGRRVYALAEGGRQANPARHPNTNPGSGSGWFDGSVNGGGFTWADGALPPNVSTFGLANTSMVMTAGHNYYWSETWAIASYNMTTRSAVFRSDPSKTASAMAAGPHCYLIGSVGLIDEPGEFALDAAGEWLYYWPRSGLPIETLEIVAPISQRPVSIVGESFVDGKVVTGLTFTGLSFIGSDGADSWYLFDQKKSNSVPAEMRQGLFFLENASNIEISNCVIRSAANTAIWLNHASQGVVIRGNWLEDIGYCGVYMYGFWPGDPDSYLKGAATTAMDTYVNRNHTVDSNLIRNVGTMNYGAAGIWLFQSGENTVSSNLINRGPRNAVGLFGPHYVAMSTVNYSNYRTPEATAANKALGGSDYGLYDIPVWGFDTMFPAMHTRNNTIINNDFSNLVRDSCDPGLLESYGVGKGQRVIANGVHDVSIPPKRWGRPEEAFSMGVQIMFSDAQTHFSNYTHNIIYEINACSGGNGAMVKNWQEVFENNLIADSSLGEDIWVGSYAGPVADMVVRHNVFHNTTGYCNATGNKNGVWPADTGVNYTPPPGAPPGVGKPSGHISVGESGDQINGNASTSCYHASCNGWKNAAQCPGPNGTSACTYHLSQRELDRPVIAELDWNLVDQTINPAMQTPRSAGGIGFQTHSFYGDPGFARTNPSWATNWSDFVVSDAAAQRVRHRHIETSTIGLGPAFSFDRALIGRRSMFRESDPAAVVGEKNHFEDEDRIRGIVKAPSAGLLSVPPGGAWSNGGFPTAPGAWAIYKNRVFNSGGAKSASVVIRANVAGDCGTPSTSQCSAEAPARNASKPHRYWRIDARPEYFDNSHGMNPMWDVCSLDFFGSSDGSGPSLLPADKSSATSGGKMISSKAGSWPAAPTCNRGNVSGWAGIHGGMSTKAENYVGWDFGDANAVSVRSIKVKQFDTQYCAKTLAVQWSDDGRCFYNAWFVNASADCPFNTTSIGGHGGVTTSPPAVEPPPQPSHGQGDTSLNITFTLGGPLSAVSSRTIGTVRMANGRAVAGEGTSAADGNAAGSCEYTGTLSLEQVPDDGTAHDLFLNFVAGDMATYLLDFFWLRAH